MQTWVPAQKLGGRDALGDFVDPAAADQICSTGTPKLHVFGDRFVILTYVKNMCEW